MTRHHVHQELALRAGPFTVAHTLHPRGLRLPRHAHGADCLHLVLSGTYQESTARGSLGHRPCTALYKPAGLPHWNDFAAGDSNTLRIEFQAGEDVTAPTGSEHRWDVPSLRRVARELQAELRRPDDFTPMAVEALCFDLLARLGRQRSRPSRPARGELVSRATRALEERFDQPLSFGGLALELGVNRSHLARAFRDAHGCTLGDHVRRLRVERVRTALERTRAPLCEIALAAGFSDQSHCTRVFRQLTGTTPAAYRRGLPDRKCPPP